jgi:hypothetical protein
MAEEAARPAAGSESFAAVVAQSEQFALPAVADERLAEFAGRICKSGSEGTFVLLTAAGDPWGDLALELRTDQVRNVELLFEDSAGRRTYRVWVAAEGEVKLAFRAIDFVSRVLAAQNPAAPQEPEPVAPWREDLARPVVPDPGAAGYGDPAAYGRRAPGGRTERGEAGRTVRTPPRTR